MVSFAIDVAAFLFLAFVGMVALLLLVIAVLFILGTLAPDRTRESEKLKIQREAHRLAEEERKKTEAERCERFQERALNLRMEEFYDESPALAALCKEDAKLNELYRKTVHDARYHEIYDNVSQKRQNDLASAAYSTPQNQKKALLLREINLSITGNSRKDSYLFWGAALFAIIGSFLLAGIY